MKKSLQVLLLGMFCVVGSEALALISSVVDSGSGIKFVGIVPYYVKDGEVFLVLKKISDDIVDKRFGLDPSKLGVYTALYQEADSSDLTKVFDNIKRRASDNTNDIEKVGQQFNFKIAGFSGDKTYQLYIWEISSSQASELLDTYVQKLTYFNQKAFNPVGGMDDSEIAAIAFNVDTPGTTAPSGFYVEAGFGQTLRDYIRNTQNPFPSSTQPTVSSALGSFATALNNLKSAI